MNSIIYVVSMIAYLSYPLTVEFNNKAVYNISKMMLAISILLFNFGGIGGMYVARILMGFSGEYSHVSAHWMLYQIAIPQHREAAIATIAISIAVYMMSFSYFSYLDDGGYWTWRLVNSLPALLLILMIVADLTLFRNINGFDYLLKTKSKEDAIKQLSTYYEEETAKMMLRENQERQSQLYTQRIEHSTEYSNQEGKSIWFKIKQKRSNIINCIIVAFCLMLAFSDPFMTNFVFIGSHQLGHKDDVKASKMMIFYSSIGSLVTSVILPILKLNQKRKLLLTSNMVFCTLCIVVCGLGYRLKKLWLVRATFIPIAASNGFIYNSFMLYLADLCSMDVISIPLAMHRLILAASQYLFPIYMSFEDSTMSQISWRFFILAAISVLSLVAVQFVMIEPDGLSPFEINKLVKGGRQRHETELLGRQTQHNIREK